MIGRTFMNQKPMMLAQSLPQRSFVKSMEDRKEEKDAAAFREDVEYFLSKEVFNLFDFHERVLVSHHICFLIILVI